jgi:hypothetical protein
MNPQIESLRVGLVNLDLQVHKFRFARILDSSVQIFKDLFCTMLLKINEDTLDFWKRDLCQSFEVRIHDLQIGMGLQFPYTILATLIFSQ